MTDVPTAAHPDLQRAIIFHGHFCPGLAIGYRAAEIALDRLRAGRAEDEELVAIVENCSCAVDAVQVITGCTFGKGNLVFHDHGKHVYTFASRPTGHAVRLSLRRRDSSAESDLSREERTKRLLAAPAEDLFDIRELTIDLPGRAEIRPSVVCDRCGEAVMDTRTRRAGGGTLCIPCASAAPSHGAPAGRA